VADGELTLIPQRLKHLALGALPMHGFGH